MTEYSNENRGVLFTNDRKTTDKHPDLKGSINIDGKEYWLSGWFKSGKSGAFTSLSAQPKEARAEPANDLRVADDHGDAIPF